MRNVPGISWGVDHHVNLLRTSKGWFALYYDYPESKPEIIKVYRPTSYDYYQMMKQVMLYNYNTCKLCPIVKAEIDATS